MKALAVSLYGMGNMSFSMTGRLLGVSDVAVLKWARAEASALPDLTVSAEVAAVEVDGMWHYLKKPAKAGLTGKTFVADDWEGRRRAIPEDQLSAGKDLTFPIEQDNSNVRHYLARFGRKTKGVSKCQTMVDRLVGNHVFAGMMGIAACATLAGGRPCPLGSEFQM